MSSFSFSLFLFPSCLYLLQRFFLHSLCFLLQTSLSFCTHSLLFFCGGHLLLCLLTRFWAMRMLSFLSTVPRFTCVLLLHVGSLIAKKQFFCFMSSKWFYPTLQKKKYTPESSQLGMRTWKSCWSPLGDQSCQQNSVNSLGLQALLYLLCKGIFVAAVKL